MTSFCGISKTIERMLEPSSMEALLRAIGEVDKLKSENARFGEILEAMDVCDECARTVKVRTMQAAMNQLAVKQ
jgi:hypothetical protein